MAAGPDQPQPQPQPQLQGSLPRAYVNFAAGQGTVTELAITLGYREGNEQPLVVAPIVLTWEFVPVLIRLLKDQLEAYQAQVGPVREIQDHAKLEGAS